MARNAGTGSSETGDKTQRGIQSVEVGGRVLRALADARRPMALADLAAAAQIAPAQAHTYLVSLTRLGLIKRDHIDGHYEPGPLALRLGMLHLDHDPAYRAAVPRTQALAAEIGHSVAISLPTPQGPTIVHFAHAGSPLHVNLHVGTVMALAATATGRTYCAFQPAAHWQSIWTRQQATTNVPGLPAFQEALAAIRERGMERSIDSPSPAVSSLAMPLLDDAGALRLILTAIGSTGAIDVDWAGPVARALRAALDDIADVFAHADTHA
ncbi:transcriptional regulator, IclR family [Cupriavidus sp. YR651]|uniref:IclR family transcriptional regulator n=1 Tax=Cupriavidus sp. YR651 TaxID=1855315 RepID=UPI0008915402|nr:helix-turn-helix domain-containing protein [Cupriavidus sp. YR651]SDC42852.1 transcriptional regulator, IclR family [Cupriavidus sp. YR651]